MNGLCEGIGREMRAWMDGCSHKCGTVVVECIGINQSIHSFVLVCSLKKVRDWLGNHCAVGSRMVWTQHPLGSNHFSKLCCPMWMDGMVGMGWFRYVRSVRFSLLLIFPLCFLSIYIFGGVVRSSIFCFFHAFTPFHSIH